MKGCAFLVLIGACCAMSLPFTPLEIEDIKQSGITLDDLEAIMKSVEEWENTDDPDQERNTLKKICQVVVANKKAVEKATVADDLTDISDVSAKEKKQEAIFEDFDSADFLGQLTRIRRVCNIELH